MKKVYWAVGVIAAILFVWLVLIPAFQGNLIINPIIQLGPIGIHWYGVILAAAILAAYFVIRAQAWKFGISVADVDDFSFWGIIVGILGARIYYVAFNWPYFGAHLSEIYKIWHGGISIYGGVIAAIIFGYFFVRGRVYTFWQLGDLIVLGLPLGQAIGRFGNFINQEAFGPPTNLPWKMFVSVANRPAQFTNYNFFQPTFLYEVIADILIFILLNKLVGRVRAGSLFLIYLLTYSFFRFFIEGLRLDSLFWYGFRVDQLVAIALVLVSGTLLYLRRPITISN